MTDHDQFRELIEAYALGSLDASDRTSVDEHLRSGCSECSKALEEARWLVTRLAYLAPEAVPSDILKGRLMHTVRAEAGSIRQKARTPIWLWAAAAAVLVFALYNAREAYVLREKIASMQKTTVASMQDREKLRGQLEEAKRRAMIMTDPKSQTFVLPASEKDWPQMKAMWHDEYGLCVMGHEIPMPKGDRTLELWLMPKTPGSKPMPLMTVRPDQSGSLYLVVAHPPEDMHNTKWLAITEEPAGGSSQPTGAPMWMGSIS
ncbi:MAG TPA: anti-sigma factor [Candidatus Acidoferrum sp.]|nr:anti-sigma factor [Candidatus Acidoferrum sp.]